MSAVPARPGGAGQYTLALARGLARHPGVTLTLVARRGDGARWDESGAARLRAEVPSSRPGRLVFEQVGLPALLREAGVSVHHGPHYTMPARSPVPCAVTIHDCTFFDHPEWHLRSKAAFFRRAIRRAALQAGALICVSQVTAERLHACVPVRAPIVVAPHGVDHTRFTPTEPSRARMPLRWPSSACPQAGRSSRSWARSSRAREWRPLSPRSTAGVGTP